MKVRINQCQQNYWYKVLVCQNVEVEECKSSPLFYIEKISRQLILKSDCTDLDIIVNDFIENKLNQLKNHQVVVCHSEYRQEDFIEDLKKYFIETLKELKEIL